MGFWDSVKRGLGKAGDWIKGRVVETTNVLRKIPGVGNVLDAAKPIGELASKTIDALNNRGSVGWGDVANAAKAVPGTIMAGKNFVTNATNQLQSIGVK